MAVGRSLPVSTKQCIEICNFIRKKPLQRAKSLLNDVIDMKIAVPFKRFTAVGHRKGKVGPGRYPIKATKEILTILESVEANAQFKGLSTANLIIIHIAANRASIPWRHGRHRGRKTKRTHVEVVVEEKALEEKKEKKAMVKPETTEKLASKDNKIVHKKVSKSGEAKK